jgi:hypothetical protein
MAVETAIICSRCETRGASTRQPERAVAEMREYLKRCGWHVGNGGPDLCPDCVLAKGNGAGR